VLTLILLLRLFQDTGDGAGAAGAGHLARSWYNPWRDNSTHLDVKLVLVNFGLRGQLK
jgi:hypothetical protein